MLADYAKLAREAMKYAFERYVGDWKKQDISTIRIDGDIYSYTTKKGIVKRFRGTNKREAVNAIHVQGLYFEPIE